MVKNTPVNIFYSINIVNHCYRCLQHVYSIIFIEIPTIKLNLTLQIFFKVINNLMSSNKLVFILQAFMPILR